ncbi:DNA (cytosine-5)-methyltransferase 3-like [Phragmites australis]|uniref:DNA (cytosine-5)-methyltransferase 3-like n=1 Tax=Phragmites australis TaxID=29695 RepID=UPI002D7787E9|nr:DNA (cytosine-5)-methyltransferase 3-like [Phragmites australis]
MAPSSPSSAAPARASSRKRAAKAARDDQIQGEGEAQAQAEEEEEEEVAASTKRRRGRSSAKKPPQKKARPARAGTRRKEAVEDDVCAEEPDEEEMAMGEEEEEAREEEAAAAASPEKAGRKRVAQPRVTSRGADHEPEFLGAPVPAAEARSKWPKRYDRNSARRPEEEEDVKARCHYRSAKVDNVVYCLNDDVYVKAGEGEADYIGRITEFFEGTDRRSYFTCQWFFRAEDTVINALVSINVDEHKHDPKRVFLSEEKNDNVLDCIISKVKIVHVDPNMDPKAKAQLIQDCDLYYDMSYSVAYSTFANISSENGASGSETTSGISSDDVHLETPSGMPERTATLLDLYSGCGGMSTGLCLGAALAGLKLETRWAVDLNSYACESLKYNHPQTEVRNEKADEFLALLREWAVLCDKYVNEDVGSDLAGSVDEKDDGSLPELDEDEFVVEKLIGICYGGSGRENGLHFKVQWQGYGPEEDTWEPIDNLSDCPLKIREFVQEGYRKRILPLPGDVDVICGGPPCQGISGFNRFRNRDEPLKDEKNKQMVTFMDIVAYLKPKYVLMENVVDIIKFADGYLGRYALSSLVAMNYQARLGMMVAGCYGLPQFRMRVFLWGALPSMVLPKYPLPTYDVVVRGGGPSAFSESIVAYDETQKPSLKKALLLGDAISDLPKVENHQPNDIMEYSASPKTEFQRYIRLSRKGMLDYSFGGEAGPDEGKLLDHQPLRLNNDDYQRVQQIPVKKGANFRDLKGVKVGANNVVEWDPEVERVYLSSGKPLVPDYAMSFIKGKSSKPFGRLWWDETVPTVVTRAEPHNQIILHPEQARVLTVRENARLQGFPDYYRLFGPIKEKYIQVGNAVAVPVARALGYCLGQAYLGESEGSHPLYKLPESFTLVGQPVAPARASSVSTPAGEVVEQ